MVDDDYLAVEAWMAPIDVVPTTDEYLTEVLRLEENDKPAARRYSISVISGAARFNGQEELEQMLAVFPFGRMHGQHCFAFMRTLKSAISARSWKLRGWRSALRRARRETRKAGWTWRERRQVFGRLK